MHTRWIKYFLLLTFAYWATGAAKYFHELIEHHGGADNCIDDDDDDSTAPPTRLASSLTPNSPSPGNPSSSAPHHGDQDCVVCKNLAAMAIEQPLPVIVPEPSQDEIAVLILHDWVAPVVRSEFIQPTTGPPGLIHI